MYAKFWNLTESPFLNTIDDRWFYESAVHEEALARLLFVVEERRRCGFLSGRAGTGKSLLLNIVSRQIPQSGRQSAFVDLAGISGGEMLASLLCSLLGFASPEANQAWLWRELEDCLDGTTASQIPTVLLFDRAERATEECLSVLERLSAHVADRSRWVSFIIAGRGSELSSGARFLRDMADLRIELTPLGESETAAYVRSLLRAAGTDRDIFDAAALSRIFAISEGIPRQINRLCDLALLAGMADDRSLIGADLINSVARELPQVGLNAPNSPAASNRLAGMSDAPTA